MIRGNWGSFFTFNNKALGVIGEITQKLNICYIKKINPRNDCPKLFVEMPDMFQYPHSLAGVLREICLI